MAKYRYTSNAGAGKHGMQEIGARVEYETYVPNNSVGCVFLLILVALAGVLAVHIMNLV